METLPRSYKVTSLVRCDQVEKRTAYASLGIPEYWRFDETGELHGARLARDRLEGGGYEPIPIETVEEGILQGFSITLNLFIRWEHGELGWHDPETGQHIATFAQERAAPTLSGRHAWPPRPGNWSSASRADHSGPPPARPGGKPIPEKEDLHAARQLHRPIGPSGQPSWGLTVHNFPYPTHCAPKPLSKPRPLAATRHPHSGGHRWDAGSSLSSD